MPYKYILSEDTPYNESSKANPENILNYDWPYNYISTIKQNLESDKLLLIPSDFFIRKRQTRNLNPAKHGSKNSPNTEVKP